jgi:hypothetical protein
MHRIASKAVRRIFTTFTIVPVSAMLTRTLKIVSAPTSSIFQLHRFAMFGSFQLLFALDTARVQPVLGML